MKKLNRRFTDAPVGLTVQGKFVLAYLAAIIVSVAATFLIFY